MTDSGNWPEVQKLPSVLPVTDRDGTMHEINLEWLFKAERDLGHRFVQLSYSVDPKNVSFQRFYYSQFRGTQLRSMYDRLWSVFGEYIVTWARGMSPICLRPCGDEVYAFGGIAWVNLERQELVTTSYGEYQWVWVVDRPLQSNRIPSWG